MTSATTFTQLPAATALNGSEITALVQAGVSVQATVKQISDYAKAQPAAGTDIINVKNYGATGNGVTNDTAAFQAALDVGGTILIPPGTYLLSPLTASVANTSLVSSPQATLHFAVLGASKAGLTITTNGFSIVGRPKIAGPAGGVYVLDETAIKMMGTSTSARLSGLTVDAEIYNFGSYGVFAKFVNDIVFTSYVHDVGYAGAAFLSCNRGLAQNFHIDTITPGTAGNAYGITLSLNTVGYNIDPNAGTKQAINPFCQDWLITGGQVENIPLWVGIDGHGGYDIRVIVCRVYNCKHGIHIAGSSGDAAAYGGWDNLISGNLVDSRKSDGTTGAAENAGTGINATVSSGPTVPGQRVWIVDNTVYGYGVPSNSGGTPAIGAENCNGVIVDGNIIENWGGVAVNVSGSPDLSGTNNKFRQLADPSDSVAICFLQTAVAAIPQTFTGNTIYANGGTAAKEGLRTASTTRPFLASNNFIAATSNALVTSHAPRFFAGTDGIPLAIFDLGGGGGTTTIDLSTLAYGTPELDVVLTASAPITVTNMTGLPIGTWVNISVALGSSDITYDRSSAALRGSANWVGSPNDTLTLRNISATGTQWIQMAGETTNG